MIRRLSRVLAVLCIFLVSSVSSLSAHQAQEQPTPDETKRAQETATLFLKRFEETGDLGRVIEELYVSDFVARYLKQYGKEVAERENPSKDVLFAPGLWYKPELLKQATSKDWRQFYIATYNFLFHTQVTGMNLSAANLLNGKDPDPEVLKNIVPAKVSSLFDAHPILRNFILRKDKPSSFSKVEDMRSAVATLEQGITLLREDNSGKSIKFTKESQQLIEMLMKTDFATPAVIIPNEEYFGFPPKTRMLLIRTAVGLGLLLTDINGKTKIVWAEATGD